MTNDCINIAFKRTNTKKNKNDFYDSSKEIILLIRKFYICFRGVILSFSILYKEIVKIHYYQKRQVYVFSKNFSIESTKDWLQIQFYLINNTKIWQKHGPMRSGCVAVMMQLWWLHWKYIGKKYSLIFLIF